MTDYIKELYKNHKRLKEERRKHPKKSRMITLRKRWLIMYYVLKGIKNRCHNPNSIGYKCYGAKGIKVCKKWLGEDGLDQFISDMGWRPNKHYDIHRIDRFKGYCKSNCKWILRSKHRFLKKGNKNVKHTSEE